MNDIKAEDQNLFEPDGVRLSSVGIAIAVYFN